MARYLPLQLCIRWISHIFVQTRVVKNQKVSYNRNLSVWPKVIWPIVADQNNVKSPNFLRIWVKFVKGYYKQYTVWFFANLSFGQFMFCHKENKIIFRQNKFWPNFLSEFDSSNVKNTTTKVTLVPTGHWKAEYRLIS